MKNFSKLIATIIFSLLILQTSFATTFTDVTDETEYQAAILWMQKNEIINGYEDETFKPDKCVNRAEFLKILFKIRAIDADESKAELFKDTPAEEWYAPYIRTARERKTIQGYKDGKFRPDQCVTRAEAIKMAILEFNNNEIPKEPANPSLLYAKDVAENAWYYEHIKYALWADIVGDAHTTKASDEDLGVINFYPEQPMSRKEVAEMLYRMKTMADNYAEYYKETDKPNTMVFTKAEVNFEINEIILTSSNDPKAGDDLEFDVYLERPDLELKENIEYDDPMPLTVDLPIQLQPKWMYLSTVNDKDQDSGVMCDRPRFPHRCKLIVIGKELEKSDHTVLLKITFEDDSYVAKKITVPHPKTLARPEIIGPTKTPEQNSKFDIEFKDVGADEYDVSVDLCKEYNDDGINPCLDGTMYHLTRNKDSNTFTISYGGNKSATVKMQNGFINVRSDFPLVFEESMSYNITATSKSKTETGIPTTIINSDSKFYPVVAN